MNLAGAEARLAGAGTKCEGYREDVLGCEEKLELIRLEWQSAMLEWLADEPEWAWCKRAVAGCTL